MRQIMELFVRIHTLLKQVRKQRKSSMNGAVEWNIHNKYARRKIKQQHRHHHHHHYHHHFANYSVRNGCARSFASFLSFFRAIVIGARSHSIFVQMYVCVRVSFFFFSSHTFLLRWQAALLLLISRSILHMNEQSSGSFSLFLSSIHTFLKVIIMSELLQFFTWMEHLSICSLVNVTTANIRLVMQFTSNTMIIIPNEPKWCCCCYCSPSLHSPLTRFSLSISSFFIHMHRKW